MLLRWFICHNFLKSISIPGIMICFCESARKLFKIKNTILYTSLKEVHEPKTVLIAQVLFESLPDMFCTNSLSKRLIPEDKLCVCSYICFEFRSTQKWIFEQGKSVRMGLTGKLETLSRRSSSNSVHSFLILFCRMNIFVQHLSRATGSFKNSSFFTSHGWRGMAVRLVPQTLCNPSCIGMSATYEATFRWSKRNPPSLVERECCSIAESASSFMTQLI